MKKLLTIILVTGFLLPSVSEARTKQELAKEYFNLPHMQTAIKELNRYSVAPVVGMITAMFDGCLKDGTDKRLENYIIDAVPFAAYEKYLIQTYVKNFSVEELEQILAFNKTKAAIKEGKLAPLMAEMLGKVIDNYMKKYEGQIQANMEKMLKSSLTKKCQGML